MARRTVRSIVVSTVVSAMALSVAAIITAPPSYAVDPVAGGQSIGDALFPNIGNTGYDTSHYDINFKADFTPSATANAVGTSNIVATTTVTAATTGAPLSSYSFDFQGSTGNLAAATLNVDSVTVNGVPATFSRIENTTQTTSTITDVHKLIITPATPVSGTFTTVVNYHGAPVIHGDTDGSAEGWGNTTDGATFLNQPIGAMTLFPNNNTPRDKATYTFTIDAPAMLRTSNYASAGGKPYQAGVVSNGELISKTPNGDGTRNTWVWDETKPMASELSFVSIGRYDIYQSMIHLNLSNRDIPEWTFIDPAISVANQTTTLSSRAQLGALLNFYESKYGPYPGNSTGLVTDVVPSAINYALETQDRPFFPNSASRGTTYHEIMHQWWGDNVAPTDWNDIPLNEGPAQYSEFQMPFEGAGSTNVTTEQANFALWTTRSNGGSAPWNVAPSAMTVASQLFGSQSYERGSIALEALRTGIGASTFETLMRNYQVTYGGGQIVGRRVAAFQAMAESLSGRDLTSFFNTWYYTTGRPAWPVKFNFGVAGPTDVLGAASPASYTLSVRNTGKVAIPSPGSTITFDASDVLDDATVGSLPTGVTQAGSTFSWVVPTTALGATSTVTIPFTVNAVEGNGTLKATAAAATLGGTCVQCSATNIMGRGLITPAATGITGGTPTVGVPLTADTTGWAAGTNFTYQWSIDGTPVPGATSASWTPTADIVPTSTVAAGFPVSVQVTGKKPGFNTTVSSFTTATNGVKATQMTGTLPSISGTPKLGGSPLVVDPGTWEPGTVFTYAWKANGTTISGATGPMYTPSVATQVGQTLTVDVTGTKFGFNNLTKTSAATSAVATNDPVTAPTPTITGTPAVGVPVVPDYGSWSDGTALTFTWQANGVNISGATAATFTPTATQLGLPLTVTVTGTKPGITAVVKVSAATANVVNGTQVLQPTPTYAGTPRAGTSTVGTQGTWDTGTTKTNKWYVDGVEIPGATATSYTPTTGQIGQTLTYEVTSVRAGYTTVVKTSTGKVILGLAQTLTPTPTVPTTAQVGVQLTGDPGTWDAGTTLSYRWLADGNPVAGATDTTFTPTVNEQGTKLTFEVTSTKATFETVTKTSAPTDSVTIGALTLTPTPTINGAPKVDVQLTAVPGTWDPGVALSYQWAVAGTDVPGAIGPTYTPVAADSGSVVTVKVTGSQGGYTSVTKESDPTAAVADGDQTLTPKPTINGTPQVAVQLTADPGTWDTGVTFTYQWTVDGADKPGATNATYTPVVADQGKVVTVKVTGTKAGYAGVTKQSDPTTAVANGTLVLTPTPTITGTAAKVAVQLTAVPGTWDGGTTLSFQWTVAGSNVAGATSSTYTPVASDAGKVVTVKVTGTKTGYDPVTKESAATSAIATGDQVLTPTPTITGTAKVGVALTAVPGTWDAGTTLSYLWNVGGVDLMSATGSTYTPAPADIGKVVIVKVTSTKAGYTSVTKQSAATAAVVIGTQTLQPTPTITGTPKVAVLLTAVPGTWDSGTTLSYQWTAGGTDVPGATGSSYAPAAGDAGKVITVKVTSTKAGYTTVTTQSAATAAVANGTQGSTPTPTIIGSPQVAVVLTLSSGLWDDGAVLTYQWTAGGTNVAGATGITYTPVPADVGKVITVKVTGTRPGYDPVTKESAATAAVALGTLTTTPDPAVGGLPKVGTTATALPGTWDSGVTFTYQWTLDTVDVPGATSSTYAIVPADLGKQLAVKVTGSKTGYTSVTKMSAPSAAIGLGDQASTPKPTVSGAVKVAAPLTAVTGSWDSGVALTYQWTVAGSNVGGATGSTYTPVVADLGKVVTVKVTGTKAGYTTVTKESDPTAAVGVGDQVATPTPTISGTAEVGQLLTLTAGSWDSGVTLTYQWLAAGLEVPGETGTSYTVRNQDIGNQITVKVTGTKAGYATVTKESAGTAVVTKGDLASTPTPSISGTPTYGATLTAVAGSWDAGANLAYQWSADGVATGATGTSYPLGLADLGKTITVTVTGSKTGYNTASRTSAGAGPVASRAFADSECKVTVTGVAKVGKKLTAQVSDCPAGTTVNYQWFAGTKPIAGANGAALKLKKKQQGKKITVMVSVSAPGYVAVLRASDPTGKVKKK